MKFQITISVEGGKRLIAEAVSHLPKVQEALKNGKILVKCGTTTSALVEKLCSFPLAASGRVTDLGTASAAKAGNSPQALLIEKGISSDISLKWEEVCREMGPGDLCFCGANLVDNNGQAALMAGASLGGKAQRFIATLPIEGVEVIILAGLEKYAPCRLSDAVKAASRKGVYSMGASVGLLPIPGTVINEIDACKILGVPVPQIIGHGGLWGGQGSTTISYEMEEKTGKEFFALVRRFNEEGRANGPSGDPKTLEGLCLVSQCGPKGAVHQGCCYRNERLAKCNAQ